MLRGQRQSKRTHMRAGSSLPMVRVRAVHAQKQGEDACWCRASPGIGLVTRIHTALVLGPRVSIHPPTREHPSRVSIHPHCVATRP